MAGLNMQSRSLKTRRQLLHSAGEVFARRGYENTSLGDIAESAGVTTGAIYFHFSSGKRQIALAIVNEQHEISIQRAGEIMQRRYSAIDSLTHMSASLGLDILTDPVIRAGISLGTEVELFPDLVRRPWDDWYRAADGLLHLGIAQGDVDPNCDIEAVAQFIGPGFAGVKMVSYLLSGYSDLLPRLRQLSEVVIPAFAAEGRREQLVQDARCIFASYEAQALEFRSVPHETVSLIGKRS
jgi:AcrR family transcriptional regulator